MKATDLPTLAACVNTLLGKLVAAQMDLEDLQGRACPCQNEREQMEHLTNEIACLERRLQRAERLQNSALASTE